MSLPSKNAVIIFASGLTIGTIFFSAVASAWTGPPGTPPNNNTAAPLNVSNTAQSKLGRLAIGKTTAPLQALDVAGTAWVNSLTVFGNTLLGGSAGSNAFLNFGATIGASGYGFRDNGGKIQFSDSSSGGVWTSLSTLAAGASQWTTSGTSIYYNGGNVGINTSSPAQKLDVNGSIHTPNGVFFDDWNTGNGMGQQFLLQNWDGTFYLSSSNAFSSVFNRFWVDPIGNGGFAGQVSAGAAVIGASPQGGTDQLHLGNTTGGTYLYAYSTADTNATIGAWSTAGSGRPLFIGTGGLFNQNNTCFGWADTGGTARCNLLLDNQSPNVLQIRNNQNGLGGPIQFRTAAGAGLTMTLDTSGNLVAYGAVSASAFLYGSDKRLKKDIEPLTGNLAKILAIQPVSYLWRDSSRGTGEQIGFIAQNVQQVAPQLVHTDASTTLESLDYARVSTLLVGSVQELDQKIQTQQSQIDAQQKEIDQLKAEIAQLKP